MSTAPAAIEHVPARWRQVLAAAATAIALGGLAFLAGRSWPLLFPKPEFAASAPAGCDLRIGPCSAVFGSERFIRFAIAPQMPPAAQPMRVLIDTAGFVADDVSVEFSGADMNMGLVAAAMLDTGGGSFAGDAVLPVCIRQRMRWHAIVTARGPDGIHRATFGFEVNKP